MVPKLFGTTTVSFCAFLLFATASTAQTTFVGNESELFTAMSSASPGTTIQFTANITLSANLPSFSLISGVTIDGAGHTLSGNNQFRGFVIGDPSAFAAPPPINIAIQNITIADTVSAGGNGQSGVDGGGGGGAGLGGAVFVADGGSVQLSGVNIISSRAMGGSGGNTAGPPGAASGGSGTGFVGIGGQGGANPFSGGFAAGGGGTLFGLGAPGNFVGGSGSGSGGGGGGGALGGAIFIAGGGSLTATGAFTINGSSVAGGIGSLGAQDGTGGAAGIFLSASGTLVLSPAAGQTIVINDVIADEAGLGGSIANTWSLDQSGPGTTVLSAASRFSGTVYINDGTLSVSSDANLGLGSDVNLTNTATLAITGSGIFAKQLFLDGTPIINVASGVNATWAGFIGDDSPASLTVAGGGTLTLTNITNAYQGGTNIIGGSTVAVTDDGALGDVTGAVTLGDGSSGGTLRFLSGPLSVVSSRDYTLGGTLGGTIDVQGSGDVLLVNVVSGTGRLTKAGSGSLYLSNVSTYTGGTNVNGGTLGANTSDVFAAGSPLSVGAGARFDMNNFNQSLGSLSGAGSVTMGSGTLTTGSSNTTSLFSGVISGTGGLVKLGSGTFTLTGANTYTGGTIVSGGTLIGNTTSLQGNIVNNAAVTFDQATAGTFGNVISGTGSLTKTGGGTLTLLGANTYSGGTTVSGGTLTGNTTSLRGNILNNAAVTFDQSFAGTYAGAMSGIGSLIKSGTGTVTLSGSNTYTGATTIAGGALQMGAGNVFAASSPIAIGAGSTLDLNGFSYTLNRVSGSGAIALGSATLTTGSDGGSTVLQTTISGNGSLVKTGSGTLTLSGANTYSGGTTVDGGVLAGTTSSLQGNITNNATVLFDQNTNGTYAGSMSGAGSLWKSGSGTVTLTGNNTYTGGTVITGGSLFATGSALQGSVVDNGNLVLGGSANNTFSGILGGNGLLTKAGTGALTLLGSHPFSGLTTVAEGTLVLNGFLGGSVQVTNGATFRASGGVTGSITLNGLLAIPTPAGSFGLRPAKAGGSSTDALSGNGIGESPLFTVGGNFFAGPGSVLQLPIGPGGVPSLLIGGTGTFNGTQLDVTAIDIGNQRNVSFLAIDALGGLSISNSAVATGNPLLVPALKQVGSALSVTILNLGVPLATGAGHNAAVGAALDHMKHDMSGDRGFVIRELTALDDAGLADALQVISGELHASSRHVAVRDSEVFTDMVRNQLTERSHEDAEGTKKTGRAGASVRWWGQVGRERTHFDGKDGAIGGTMDLTDSAGGFDMKLSTNWLIGGGGGLGLGSMGLDGLGGSTEVTAPRAFGVVGFRPKGFGIMGGGSFARSKSKAKRSIVVVARLPEELGGEPLTGGIDRDAAGEELTVQNDQWTEYSDKFDIKTYRFDFMFGLRRARFSREGFTESGAGALSLLVADEILHMNEADVKVHLWRREGSMRPYFETLYRRSSQWPDKTTVAFAEDRDAAFETAGLPMGSNAFASRAGVVFVRKIGTLTFEYRFRRAAGQTVQGADLRFRF